MIQLILVRHGESLFNKENRFTGWTDVDLTNLGIKEAEEAGHILSNNGYTFDLAFTSVLKRTIRSLWIIQDVMDLIWTPSYSSWRLNERHYGALQELNKEEAVKEFGAEQVNIWRRSYDIKPPEIKVTDWRFPCNDARYKDLGIMEIPLSESLKETQDRLMPYWFQKIVPLLKAGQKPIIIGHGNSLRALIKYLDNISDQEIVNLNIPTGIPIIYELDNTLKPVRHFYLNKNSIENIKEIL